MGQLYKLPHCFVQEERRMSKKQRNAPYYTDRLVMRWKNPTHSQGKRMGKDCPLTREEIRTYVEHGTWSAVKLIAQRIGDPTEALNLLNSVRRCTINRAAFRLPPPMIH